MISEKTKEEYFCSKGWTTTQISWCCGRGWMCGTDGASAQVESAQVEPAKVASVQVAAARVPTMNVRSSDALLNAVARPVVEREKPAIGT
jgi:hypothetical protein